MKSRLMENFVDSKKQSWPESYPWLRAGDLAGRF